MIRSRPLLSPPLGLALAVGLAALAAGPASASQIEGGTIGTPLHSSSTAPSPTRAPVDAGSARGGAGETPRGTSSAERHPGNRAPATPASGPHRGG